MLRLALCFTALFLGIILNSLSLVGCGGINNDGDGGGGLQEGILAVINDGGTGPTISAGLQASTYSIEPLTGAVGLSLSRDSVLSPRPAPFDPDAALSDNIARSSESQHLFVGQADFGSTPNGVVAFHVCCDSGDVTQTDTAQIDNTEPWHLHCHNGVVFAFESSSGDHVASIPFDSNSGTFGSPNQYSLGILRYSGWGPVFMGDYLYLITFDLSVNWYISYWPINYSNGTLGSRNDVPLLGMAASSGEVWMNGSENEQIGRAHV